MSALACLGKGGNERIERDATPIEARRLPSDTTEAYCRQLVSEGRVKKPSGGYLWSAAAGTACGRRDLPSARDVPTEYDADADDTVAAHSDEALALSFAERHAAKDTPGNN
jgi:hypothetical protein